MFDGGSNWGRWFGGYNIDAPPTNAPKPIVPPGGYGHSPGCKMLKLRVGELMVDLDLLEQDFILECPHYSHEAVKQMFRYTCNSEITTPQEGRLF